MPWANGLVNPSLVDPSLTGIEFANFCWQLVHVRSENQPRYALYARENVDKWHPGYQTIGWECDWRQENQVHEGETVAIPVQLSHWPRLYTQTQC
jgi:hypothetical protein